MPSSKKSSSKKKTTKATTGDKPRSGVGAKGGRGTPAGRDSGPKWRGGGTKGENEQTAR